MTLRSFFRIFHLSLFLGLLGLLSATTPGNYTIRDVSILIFPPWNLESETDTLESNGTDYADILFETLLSTTSNSRFQEESSQAWDAYFTSLESDDVFGLLPLLAAEQEDADLAIASYYRLEEARVFLMIKIYDVRKKRLLGAEVDIARSGLSFINTAKALADKVIEQIYADIDDILFMKNNPGILTGSSAATVIFFSKQEAMHLHIPGLGAVGTIENGLAELAYQTLAMGRPMQIQKEADGYYTDYETFIVRDTYNEVFLSPLYQKSTKALELYWNFWTATGFGLAWRQYLLADQSFFRLAYLAYMQFPLKTDPPGANILVHHDISLYYGQYLFFPPNSSLRLLFSIGAGLILRPTQNLLFTDTYISLASLTLEYNTAKWSFFVSQELRYSYPLFSQHANKKGLSISPFLPLQIGVMRKWK